MSENMKEATKYIEQGHVRVGPEVVKDPAFLVTRALEDFVTWVDGSAIRRHVMEYNDLVSFNFHFFAILRASSMLPSREEIKLVKVFIVTKL